jgi:hypothetical protein
MPEMSWRSTKEGETGRWERGLPQTEDVREAAGVGTRTGRKEHSLSTKELLYIDFTSQPIEVDSVILILQRLITSSISWDLNPGVSESKNYAPSFPCPMYTPTAPGWVAIPRFMDLVGNALPSPTPTFPAKPASLLY